MCTRLGKRHRNFVGSEGLNRLKTERSSRNPKVCKFDTYMVQNLLTVTCLRDVYWNPQSNCKKGLAKRIKRSKQALYDKLEKYGNRL